ncbi:hypothetical protein KDW_08180 [Dictyobacter vulcani]|uniref:Uncharacterized protein n=1 Tax=Dictyobacter vulcani TaxID=2607529 RepID=A0A5J4KN85_9CHLR|nr:hypothetical protein KDW_08180 [Dictyobacter vulcani]
MRCWIKKEYVWTFFSATACQNDASGVFFYMFLYADLQARIKNNKTAWQFIHAQNCYLYPLYRVLVHSAMIAREGIIMYK